jgi:hypothetical protein
MGRFGPWLVRLADDPAYLRRAASPAYWRLAPYYVGQHNDTSCSVATAAMLVNAVRAGAVLAGPEPIVTPPALLARVADPVWTAGCGTNEGRGVSLRQLADLTRRSFTAYGMEPAAVEAVEMDGAEGQGVESRAAEGFFSALASMEEGGGLVAVNFHSGIVYGAGDYGHFSPVGAYDEANAKLLVLDVDRSWYEPFWVPVDIMLRGMATISPVDGGPRGFLRLRAPWPGVV